MRDPVRDPEIDALAREARQRRRLPPGAACETCGGARQLSVRPDGRVLCYEHLQVERGRSPVEADHLAGRENLGGLVVRLQANDHRTVTEMRQRLGTDEWPAAEGDPLLTLAHLLAGVASLLVLVAEWLVDHALHLQATVGAVDPTRPFPVVP